MLVHPSTSNEEGALLAEYHRLAHAETFDSDAFAAVQARIEAAGRPDHRGIERPAWRKSRLASARRLAEQLEPGAA